MNNWKSVVAALAIASAIVTGCSKGSDKTADPSAMASGPVTDEAESGLKAADAPSGAPALGNVDHGNSLFDTNCASCHGAGGKGGGIGPVLTGEKERKNFAAAVAWIKNPVLPMPKLYPKPLSESDVDDVAAYVESL